MNARDIAQGRPGSRAPYQITYGPWHHCYSQKGNQHPTSLGVSLRSVHTHEQRSHKEHGLTEAHTVPTDSAVPVSSPCPCPRVPRLSEHYLILCPPPLSCSGAKEQVVRATLLEERRLTEFSWPFVLKIQALWVQEPHPCLLDLPCRQTQKTHVPSICGG